MGLIRWYLEYDFTERLLYGLALLFTVWFLAAVAMKKDKRHWFRDWGWSGFSAVWLALIIRALVAEVYSIPSESMVPTLLISDHLLVSKTSFGWHVPFTQGRFLRYRAVRRGEIVIFVPPHAPKQSYVKRCVGLPGDSIEVKAKQVFINGAPAEVPFSFGRLAEIPAESLPALQSAREAYLAKHQPRIQALLAKGERERAHLESNRTTWLGPFALTKGTYFVEASVNFQRAYGRLIDAPQVGAFETLPKDFRSPSEALQLDWARDNGLGNRDWFGPYKLKPGEYWMMGDNRDNSSDSRFFGPVREEDLRGTPVVRYWPMDRMGLLR